MSDKRPETSWKLAREGAVLVLIDVQQKLAPAMDQGIYTRALANMKRLLAGASALQIPTIVTEQYPQGLGPTVTELTDDIRAAHLVTKIEFDAGKNKPFNDMLHALHAKTVILAGIETHICVLQTAITLRERFPVWVAGDAVCSRLPANVDAGLRLAGEAGAVIAPTESILFGMLEKAGTPEFKAISKIVR